MKRLIIENLSVNDLKIIIGEAVEQGLNKDRKRMSFSMCNRQASI